MNLRAKDYRAEAREKLSGHWAVSVGTAIVASLLGGVTYSTSTTLTSDIDLDELFEQLDLGSADALYNQIMAYIHTYPVIVAIVGVVAAFAAVWGIATTILGGPTRVGYCQYNINLLKGEGEFNDLFSHYNIFLKAFLAKLLQGIFLALWFCLLIVPGVIMSYAYSMTFYILAENPNLDPVAAIKHSRKMMKGHKWQFFCLQLSFIGWAILAALTLGIGGLFLTPYMEAADAAFYKNVSSEYFASLNKTEEKLIEE